MAFPLAAVVSVIPTVIQSLSHGASLFGADEGKMEKITKIASAALGGVGWAIDAFKAVKDRIKGHPITEQDFDDLIAAIDANSDKLKQLHEDTVAREEAGEQGEQS